MKTKLLMSVIVLTLMCSVMPAQQSLRSTADARQGDSNQVPVELLGSGPKVTISNASTLSSPSDGAIGIGPSGVTLSWLAEPGATHYRVNITGASTGAVAGSPFIVVAPATSQALPLLASGETYSWFVEVSSDNQGTWPDVSPTWTFFTNFLTSPANYSVGVSILTTFTWTAVAAPTTYDLEVSTSPTFSSLVTLTGSTGIAGTSYTVDYTNLEKLDNGTLYYWRVKDNNSGKYSATWEFTTVNAATPVISSLTTSGNTANVGWYTSPYAGGLKYDILLSTNSNMSSYTTAVAGLTDLSYTLTGLSSGTTYYIQVVSYTGSGPYVYYTYSDIKTFTMPGVPVPYLSYPTGGATVYFNPSTVYYYTGTYFPGLQFEVRYSANSSVDGNGMLNSGANSLALTTNLFAVLPTLTAGQTYYWEVRSYDGTNYSSWSTVESFVIYSSASTTPIVPYPSYPTTGTTVYINPPTFYWYLGTYATGLEFYVEWDDASNFTTPLGNSGWISTLYFTLPSNLTPGTTYYWHVKSRLAVSPFTESSYSTTQSFDMASTVNGGAAQAYPVSPTGGISVGTPLASNALNWTAFSAVTLEFQVRISPYSSTDGSGMLNHPTAVSSSWTTGTSITMSSIPFTLTAGATYYWQVRSRLQSNTSVVSSWSYVGNFVTAAGSFAVVPMVGSPSHGQPINSSSALLSWILPTESNSHLKYDVEYSTNKDFNNSVMVSDVNEPVLNISGLEPKSTYYWRVLSKTESGSFSNYSETGSFKTDGVTGVEQKEELPASFELEQNYPNPFNPSTRISYSLPENSFVLLKVYDMLGREVKTLINNNMNAGRHSVDWNGEDNLGNKVASGTYIYRITAGKFVISKKMLFIK